MAVHGGTDLVTKGLIFCVDALDKHSYPGTGTTWTDVIGGNDGTFNSSPTWNSSGYFDFNGYRSTHGNDSSLDLTSAITLSCWFNADDTSGFKCWMGKGQNQTYMIFFNGSKIRMRIGGNLTANAIDSSSDYTTGTWTNVVGTYDGSNMKIYINGSLDQTKARSGTIPTNSANLGIGHDGANSLTFDGKIAASSIYNRALTLSEVQQNFNAQRGRFGI